MGQSVSHGVGFNPGMAGRSKMPQSQSWHLGWLLAWSSAWADDQRPGCFSTQLCSFLSARWLSSKKEPFKHTNAEATILFSPALEITPHHFCPIGLLQKGNRASSDPKRGKIESLSLGGRITKYSQPSLIPHRKSYLNSRQCHINELITLRESKFSE